MSARHLLSLALLSACAEKPEPPKPFTNPETHMAACMIEGWPTNTDHCWNKCVESFPQGSPEFDVCWSTGWRVTLRGVIASNLARPSE